MKKTKTLTVKIEVNTDKSIFDILAAAKKGIYYGLDTKGIAAPKDVKIKTLSNKS